MQRIRDPRVQQAPGVLGIVPTMEALAPSVLSQLDLAIALEQEIGDSSQSLPTPFVDLAVRERVDEVSEWFGAQARQGKPLAPQQIIGVGRGRHGLRPAGALGLYERTLYRAFVQEACMQFPPLSRDNDTFEAFQKAPLDVPDAQYILETDVSSYYEYVDHERLHSEMLDQGSSFESATRVIDWLGEVTGRGFGLPQTIAPSHPLGEIYIDIMERRLIREGYRVFRYADDFRFALTDYDDVLRATESSFLAARDLGLVLNDSKTYAPKRDQYMKYLNRPAELMESISASAEADLGGWNEYTSEVESPEDAEIKQEAAHQLLDYWVRESEDDEYQRSREAHITSRLLGQSIGVMAALEDPYAVGATRGILSFERVHTARLCSYLIDASSPWPDAAAEAVLEALKIKGMTQWQHLWLLQVAIFNNPLASLAAKDLDAWATRLLGPEWSEVVRASACVLLARRGKVDLALAQGLYEQVSPVARPTVTAAMAVIVQGNNRKLRAVREGSLLQRLVTDWAAANLQ